MSLTRPSNDIYKWGKSGDAGGHRTVLTKSVIYIGNISEGLLTRPTQSIVNGQTGTTNTSLEFQATEHVRANITFAVLIKHMQCLNYDILCYYTPHSCN